MLKKHKTHKTNCSLGGGEGSLSFQPLYFSIFQSIWCIVPKQPCSHFYKHIYHTYTHIHAHAWPLPAQIFTLHPWCDLTGISCRHLGRLQTLTRPLQRHPDRLRHACLPSYSRFDAVTIQRVIHRRARTHMRAEEMTVTHFVVIPEESRDSYVLEHLA